MSEPRQYVELFLTCESTDEATRIADVLLQQHLIVCAKQLPISAQYWWEGKIEQANEVLLIMESAADLFNKVEAEVAKIHSYETFVLQALPFVRISKKASEWINDNLRKLGA